MKDWWKSKGIWGSLITILAGISSSYGYLISPDIVQEATTIVDSIIVVAAGTLAFVGRIKAVERIK